MNRHTNIALFVAHEGCPQRCTFCNQNIITKNTRRVTAEDVDEAVGTALASGAKNAQIAFFGGSFTAVDRSYMMQLLEAAHRHIENGDVSSVRISTRPDFIDDEILDILEEYGVTAIELGAQSMDDDVLTANRRGHTAQDVADSSQLIKSRGFELGLQMMTGLYKDTDEKCIKTAQKIIALSPETVRIYPTVVLEHTELARLYRSGEYVPQTVESAAQLCAKLIPMFDDAGIKIIRLGLHSGGGVGDGYIAGAYHPAFGEICESMLFRDMISSEFEQCAQGEYDVFCDSTDVSKIKGQKRSNIGYFHDKGYELTVIPQQGLGKRNIRISKKEEDKCF